jgi:hypothetical protein
VRKEKDEEIKKENVVIKRNIKSKSPYNRMHLEIK